MKAIPIFLCLFCIGFTAPSYKDFRAKGRIKTQDLIAELKKIRTKDQLIAKEEELQLVFQELETLVKEVQCYQKSNPEDQELPLSQEDKMQSEVLCKELLRLLRLEGGAEILSRINSQ